MEKNVTISRCLLPALIALSAITAPAAAHEAERLPDINKVLAAYGCIENGKYNYGAYVVTKASLLGDPDNISHIEGMKDLLDTPEEFITASYYRDLPVMSEMRIIIDTELPRGKIGALRLASMWLKKCAEDRDNYGKYMVAVNIIKEKSELSDKEFRSYFNKAIENKIHRIAMDNLGSLFPQKNIYNEIIVPVIAYYTIPNIENENNLVNAGVKLFNENKLKGDGFINTLIKLNDKFAIKIINEIHGKRTNKTK
ncbi:MAG: hypothetical protein A2176_03050 [Spirochaetes bacterium RBG_13_51_14]|nr:MAG: hypothetical protein A2176_03050 [Spirochaetes bacterium RBG_13_51_14]